jgi:hypothetical protein
MRVKNCTVFKKDIGYSELLLAKRLFKSIVQDNITGKGDKINFAKT